jgi:protein TonB
MAKEFVRAAQLEPDSVVARRFDRNCDDNAGEYTFGVLHARLEPVPLYEIRFLKGSQLFRLFSFAFVDGAFRFILTPKLEGPVFSGSARGNGGKSTQGEKPERVDRLAIGGNVQAARLIHRENPIYPEDARREHLQGTVNLHALIGKDGSIKNLYVLKGYCSLAEASLRSVQKWRYSPTLLEGSPVEVDTQIAVIFQLSRGN